MNSHHLKALNKVGDIYCPSHKGLPSFSELGCSKALPIVASQLPEQDAKDLKLLLFILSFTPVFIIRWIIRFIENFRNLPGSLGDNIRKMRFGLRGLSYSLYFSGIQSEDFQGIAPVGLIIKSTNHARDKS